MRASAAPPATERVVRNRRRICVIGIEVFLFLVHAFSSRPSSSQETPVGVEVAPSREFYRASIAYYYQQASRASIHTDYTMPKCCPYLTALGRLMVRYDLAGGCGVFFAALHLWPPHP